MLMADALTQIGLLQLEMGQPEKALSRLEQALSLAVAEGDRQREMHLAGRLGNIFMGLESTEKALEYLAEAHHAAERLGNRAAQCLYLLHMGNVLLANRELEAAVEQFETALNIAAEIDNPGAELSALGQLLRAYVVEGNLSRSLLYGDHAIRLAREQQNEGAEIDNINLLTAFLIDQGSIKRRCPIFSAVWTLPRTSWIGTGSLPCCLTWALFRTVWASMVKHWIHTRKRCGWRSSCRISPPKLICTAVSAPSFPNWATLSPPSKPVNKL
jgi:tetratricopeptide (TPR) repeat protein